MDWNIIRGIIFQRWTTADNENYGSLHIYFIVQILPFIDWTLVCAREECVAMTENEMTWSLLVDLVFNDVAPTSEP